MERDTPLIRREITNNNSPLDWKFGESETNVILENSRLNVKLLRYIITSKNNVFSYDTFSVRESKNNTVVLVRNQSNQIGLVWEWRPIPEKWFWACVRGFAGQDDKDNISTAKREMIEEVGLCKVIKSRKIANLYQNTTYFENPVGLVILDVEEVEKNTSQEEGIVDFKFYSKDELLKMIREDKIEDTFTLSALMRFFALDGF